MIAWFIDWRNDIDVLYYVVMSDFIVILYITGGMNLPPQLFRQSFIRIEWIIISSVDDFSMAHVDV